VRVDIAAEHLPLDPVHKDDRIELSSATRDIDKKFLVAILHPDEPRGRDEAEVIANLAVGILTGGLVAGETLHGDERAIGATQLEYDGEIASRDDRLIARVADDSEGLTVGTLEIFRGV
jgi:hypothetical protein